MVTVRKAKRKSRVTKSDRRRVDDNIDHPDEYDASTGFAPEDISRRLEENLREKRQRGALGNAFRPMGNNNNNVYDADFDGTEGDLPSPPKKSRHYRRGKAFNSFWEQHKDVVKGWFCKAASFGTPDPTLKQPYASTEVACNCNKQSTSVHVFMTHNVHELQIKHCKCRSLVETMILMQVFPSSASKPKSGCHFAEK